MRLCSREREAALTVDEQREASPILVRPVSSGEFLVERSGAVSASSLLVHARRNDDGALRRKPTLKKGLEGRHDANEPALDD